ncbi:MAG TPA: TIM-barrel domain-containing protein [Terrimicrobiaceae bacterium]|nr:TIM-barrel domain-containing protein [Terrimicrobiaceae bacterium]
MHFHKYSYVTNFEFVTKIVRGRSFKTGLGRYGLAVNVSGLDLYHIQIRGPGWERGESEAGLRFPKASTQSAGERTRLIVSDDGGMKLEEHSGKCLLSSAPGRFFGQCGPASIFEFLREEGDLFYGMGEKWTGLEHSGKTTKFWNTDVWADFNENSFIQGKPAPDPVYLSIPYLILRRRDVYLGFLLDNPRATFISTGFRISIADQMDVTPAGEDFSEAIIEGAEKAQEQTHIAPHGFLHLGCEEGQPNLYIIVGPSLAELTCKMQKLVGTTPRPPVWALGYHQCRWGYESERDLLWLDGKFRKHGVPVDGLWLDIDYMRGYRVFTFQSAHFPNPGEAMAKLARNGRKVVAIIDPGVKLDKSFLVYQRGRKERAFCLNPQKKEFVGLVWPGETVFPDFSMATARQWWAREVAQFVHCGIQGAWIDMNDPATGPADYKDMLFDRGKKDHGSYHNQYALGMAMATRDGFLRAHPGLRPFLLSRSGFTGSNRYTAIWTGDNYSNYLHFRNSIPTTLNLALSGIPFNGPDVGGFGGDTTPELMMDWFKAGFLFPFLRNHSFKDTRRQEPWAFGAKVLKVLRRYIQLRYRFRPYLYQLFLEHERTGEAILRPLFYDFPDTADLPLGLVDDQFMVGPRVLQAPFLEERQKSRAVILPGTNRWYDLTDGVWREGESTIRVRARYSDTPIYIRDGSILPLARLEPTSNAFQGGHMDFHVFISADGEASTKYEFDDGTTFEFQKGACTELEITAVRTKDGLAIASRVLRDSAGPPRLTFTAPAEIRRVTINGRKAKPCSAQGVPIGNGRMKTWSASGAGLNQVADRPDAK